MPSINSLIPLIHDAQGRPVTRVATRHRNSHALRDAWVVMAFGIFIALIDRLVG